MAESCRTHCAVDLKWGEAETMAMKKTWQLTSITSPAQNGAAGKRACRTRRNICLLPTCRHVSQYQSRGGKGGLFTTPAHPRRPRSPPFNGNRALAWRLIALISSRRSHQLFYAINRLPSRCHKADCRSGSEGRNSCN